MFHLQKQFLQLENPRSQNSQTLFCFGNNNNKSLCVTMISSFIIMSTKKVFDKVTKICTCIIQQQQIKSEYKR